MDEEELVCPFIIWKLDCDDWLGPMSTSNSSGMFPARNPLTFCVLMVYVSLNCSPTATCAGAFPTRCCAKVAMKAKSVIYVSKSLFIICITITILCPTWLSADAA